MMKIKEFIKKLTAVEEEGNEKIIEDIKNELKDNEYTKEVMYILNEKLSISF